MLSLDEKNWSDTMVLRKFRKKLIIGAEIESAYARAMFPHAPM
jgi:hypothetical protein